MKVLTTMALIVFLASFSSCSKVVECCNGGNCETISQSEFDSESAFDSEVQQYEANGFTCQ